VREGASIGLASDGGFAARVRFPAYCVVPLPPEVSDRAGALLEPLAVGLHALERAGSRAGDRVVISGFGPIGAAAAAAARAIGVSPLVCEPSAGRGARAEEQGLETVVPEGEPSDVARAVRERTGGGAQAVIECSGAEAGLAAALEMTVRGGNIVVVGLPKTKPQVDAARLVLFERGILGALGYRHDLPRVAQLIASGHLDAELLITRVIELPAAPAEFRRLVTDPGDDLKVLVTPVVS